MNVFKGTNSYEVNAHYNRPSQSDLQIYIDHVDPIEDCRASQCCIRIYNILLINVRAGVRVRVKVDEEPKCNYFRAVATAEMSSYN